MFFFLINHSVIILASEDRGLAVSTPNLFTVLKSNSNVGPILDLQGIQQVPMSAEVLDVIGAVSGGLSPCMEISGY